MEIDIIMLIIKCSIGKGLDNECVAEMPVYASVAGVMGGYVFYYVYSGEENPKLFQIKCRW